jgi:hypothetical protein
MRIPRVDFTSLNFADLPLQLGEATPIFLYDGHQYSVQKVVVGQQQKARSSNFCSICKFIVAAEFPWACTQL